MPTSFSAEVYNAAIEPPTFQAVGGKVFVGVFVSADEWWRIAPQIARAATGELTMPEQRALMEEMTNLSFPRPWWQFWRRRVWTYIRRLPWAAQLEAVSSFTEAQATANIGIAWAKRRATNGNGSPS